MTNKEYYTIKEIADLLGVSKTTINNTVKLRSLEYDRKEKNKFYYSLEKTMVIISCCKPEFDLSIFENQIAKSQTETAKSKNESEKLQSENENSQSKIEKSQSDPKNEIETLNRMFDMIQKQLDEKDKQLAIKDRQIEDLSERLKEAMNLTKGAQYITAADKTQQLLEVEKIKDPAADPEEAAADHKKRKSFFSRFFG